MLIKTGKKIDKKEIDKTLKKAEKKRVFNSKKHLGKVSWGEDALTYQKKIRDEWN